MTKRLERLTNNAIKNGFDKMDIIDTVDVVREMIYHAFYWCDTLMGTNEQKRPTVFHILTGHKDMVKKLVLLSLKADKTFNTPERFLEKMPNTIPRKPKPRMI